MSAQEQRHFVAVWNPSYASDAMDAHLRILLDLARRCRRKGLPEDERYVWWGKVKSPNRQTPQAHLDEIRAIAEEVDELRDGETQLYLTDSTAGTSGCAPLQSSAGARG